MVLRKLYPFLLNTLALIIAYHHSQAQNITSSVLIWEAEQATDQQTNQTIGYEAKFKTMGSSSVEWIQKGGQQITSYEVTGTEGSWTNISVSGSFTYLLRRNGNTAQMIIEKNINGTFITLKFLRPEESTIQHRFKIKSVQPQ